MTSLRYLSGPSSQGKGPSGPFARWMVIGAGGGTSSRGVISGIGIGREGKWVLVARIVVARVRRVRSFIVWLVVWLVIMLVLID